MKIKLQLVLRIVYFNGLISVSSCYVHFVYLDCSKFLSLHHFYGNAFCNLMEDFSIVWIFFLFFSVVLLINSFLRNGYSLALGFL